MPRDLREDPLQPPSCGADDFSKGAKRLTQKVLGEKKKREEKCLYQRTELRFPQGCEGKKSSNCNYELVSHKYLQALAMGPSSKVGRLGQRSRSYEKSFL